DDDRAALGVREGAGDGLARVELEGRGAGARVTGAGCRARAVVAGQRGQIPAALRGLGRGVGARREVVDRDRLRVADRPARVAGDRELRRVARRRAYHLDDDRAVLGVREGAVDRLARVDVEGRGAGRDIARARRVARAVVADDRGEIPAGLGGLGHG